MQVELIVVALAALLIGALLGLSFGWRKRRSLELELAAAERRVTELQDLRDTVGSTFKALSAEALQANNEQFLQLARERLERQQQAASGDLSQRQQAIDGMVKPLREALVKVDEKIQQLERSRTGAYEGLHTQIRGLLDAQNLLHGETRNLVHALKTPSVRGRWGELQLERTLEFAGLTEHIHFSQQTNVRDGDGSSLRPDVVVQLPGDKCLIIDAKAPMEAYLRALECRDEPERLELLKRHARHIRSHAQQLSSKAYWRQFDRAPEFVVLFIPGEAFFSAALEQDPELISFASTHNVLLATPTTLIGLLKVVSHGWRQEAVADRATEIANLGRELHERLVVQTGHFEDIGKALNRAVESYNRTLRSLESRVLVSSRRFESLLPSAPAKSIPALDPIDSKAAVSEDHQESST